MTSETGTDALMVKGALMVADAAVYDHSDMYRIALKTLAHEYRVLRAKSDQLKRRLENAYGGNHG